MVENADSALSSFIHSLKVDMDSYGSYLQLLVSEADRIDSFGFGWLVFQTRHNIYEAMELSATPRVLNVFLSRTRQVRMEASQTAAVRAPRQCLASWYSCRCLQVQRNLGGSADTSLDLFPVHLLWWCGWWSWCGGFRSWWSARSWHTWLKSAPRST